MAADWQKEYEKAKVYARKPAQATSPSTKFLGKAMANPKGAARDISQGGNHLSKQYKNNNGTEKLADMFSAGGYSGTKALVNAVSGKKGKKGGTATGGAGSGVGGNGGGPSAANNGPIRPEGRDMRANDRLNEYALGHGDSAWGRMAKRQQGREEANSIDMSAKQQGGAEAEARDQLAMRGGLSGGAAERLASGGADNLLLSQQGVRNEGAQARGRIEMMDEAQRFQALQQAPEMNAGVWNDVMKQRGADALSAAYDKQAEGKKRSQSEKLFDPFGNSERLGLKIPAYGRKS